MTTSVRDYHYRAHQLEIDGARAFVEEAGDGPAVLCIHTADQSGVQWYDALRVLPGRGYRVVVPDLAGHGRSAPAALGPIEDLSAYRDWLLQALDRLDIAEFYVVGCSIGGKITLDIAAAAPDRLKGAVAMGAVARNTALSERGLRRGMAPSSNPSAADRAYLGTLASVGANMDAERATYGATMHRREDPVISNCDLIGWIRHDLRDRLADITCPVRWINGADDFWIDHASAEWGVTQVPHCQFEVRTGVGHYPMEEIPAFAESLADWLDDWEKR